MFVAGMWFQDLWTYDFRRTEMCIIPVRDADGGDLVLRLQHRRRLAADRREDVPERVGGGMVQGTTASTRCTPTRGRRCRSTPTRSRCRCGFRAAASSSSGSPATARAAAVGQCRVLVERTSPLKSKRPGRDPGLCLSCAVSSRCRYSTSFSFSCASSAAIRSDRRKRRSFALISTLRRSPRSAFCGAPTFASAPGWSG